MQIYQFTDAMALALKATVSKFIVEKADRNLPSSRDAKIQVGKYDRMIKAFDKKFPPDLELTLPPRKFGKMRGIERHKVNQQGKVVDRLLRKLIGEMAVAALQNGSDAGNRKPTNGQIRKASQKLIRTLNSSIRLTSGR